MSNFIRVLRNGSIYADRAAAKSALQEKLATLQDGEICLASYGANWGEAKTILGVVRAKTVGSDTKRSYTIFDNEDIAGIVATIEKLDATVSGESTDKHVKVQIIETDGKLTSVAVTTDDIASAKLLGTKDDEAGVDTAFGRIKAEAAARATAITNAIAALDSSVAATAAVDNKVYSVLTGVTQTDGKLTGKTEVTLAAVAKTGSAEDVANAAITGGESQVAVNGTNVRDQISSIATTLKTVEKSIAEAKENDLKYITHKLTTEEVTALGDSNVKDAYQVFAYTGTWNATSNKGTQVGDTIKIYKDASIHKIYLGSEADTINETTGVISTVTPTEANLRLNYAYLNANGTYELVKVPVDSFLRESEFKDGLQVNSGVVSVKVDDASEGGFLSVSGAGVKVSGVQTAINNAIAGLDATVTSNNNGNVSVTVAQTDGKVSGVTVSTTGLALESEVIKGVTVNGVDAQVSAEKKATVTIKGGNIAVADTYTATKYSEPFETKVGTANHIAAGDKIDAAFKKTENTISVLATEVISNEKVTTAAITELAKSAGVTNTDGVIKYTPDTNTTYLKTAASVHDATVKLDAAITTVDGKITALGNEALKSLNGSSAITVSGDTANSKTVSLKLDSVKTDNALTVTDNGLYLSNVWDCGEY